MNCRCALVDDPTRERSTGTRPRSPPGHNPAMQCRPACAACCIAPSISSPIPGMPKGKAAGMRCIQLTPENRCALFGDPRRPAVCMSLKPSPEMCGGHRDEALLWLATMEILTAAHP